MLKAVLWLVVGSIAVACLLGVSPLLAVIAAGVCSWGMNVAIDSAIKEKP
jgi:hypothetical protein